MCCYRRYEANLICFLIQCDFPRMHVLLSTEHRPSLYRPYHRYAEVASINVGSAMPHTDNACTTTHAARSSQTLVIAPATISGTFLYCTSTVGKAKGIDQKRVAGSLLGKKYLYSVYIHRQPAELSSFFGCTLRRATLYPSTLLKLISLIAKAHRTNMGFFDFIKNAANVVTSGAKGFVCLTGCLQCVDS